MARRSKNLAAKPVADADLPHIEDVFDRENWESRMTKARKSRENVLTHLDEIGSDKSKSRTKKKAVANETEEPAVSLKKVMETRNLKERLELAQKRHAQVQRKNKTGAPSSGFVYTQKSTDEFKKVVLNAKPVGSELDAKPRKLRSEDGLTGRKTLPPLAHDDSAHLDEEPKKRAFLGFGLLASGIAAAVVAVVLIGGLPDQSGIVETTSVATPSVQLPSPPIELDVNYLPAALTFPSDTPNLLSGVALAAVTRSAAPDGITYLGGAEDTPKAAAPLPILSGAVEVTWQIESSFARTPADNLTASVLSVAANVQPDLHRTLGVGLVQPLSQPVAFALPLDNSLVSLSLISPEIVTPLITDKVGLSIFGGDTQFDRVPNTLATEDLLVSLESSLKIQFDTAPAIDTVAPDVPVAPEKLIAEGLPAHNIRVFAPTSLSEKISGDVVVRLNEAGFDVGSLKSVGLRISSNNVRYYHSADAEVAIALADLISAKARDFTNFSPRPPLGTVELWLKGAAPQATARQARPRNSSNDPALQALRDRLAQRLRSGDHLGGG